MTNSVSVLAQFDYENAKVRIIEGEDGKPWFCAVDVCKLLMLKRVSESVSRYCDASGVATLETKTGGGLQKLLFISEPNLYRLICKPKTIIGSLLSKWLFDVVIPASRIKQTSPEGSDIPFNQHKTRIPTAEYNVLIRSRDELLRTKSHGKNIELNKKTS